MGLSTISKTLIAGALAGGILITGITFTGDKNISNIRDNVDNLRDKLEQAIDDNAFITGQFDSLKDLYTSAVGEANSTISSLQSAKDALASQVVALQTSLTAKEAELQAVLADSTATELEQAEAKTVLQEEVSRLEAELTKANQAIADLEAYTLEADTATEYTATNREEFEVTELAVASADTSTPVVTEPEAKPFISASALEYNKAVAETLALPANTKAIYDGYRASSSLDVTVTGVTTTLYTSGSTRITFLAYEIADLTVTAMPSTVPTAVRSLVQSTGENRIYFVDQTGKQLAFIDKNGAITRLP